MANNSIPKTGEEAAREQERAADRKKQAELEAPRGPLQTERGNTTIDEGVVAKIAGMAAREVNGVYAMGGAIRRAFNAVTERIPNSSTNVTGGISVEKGERQTAIDVNVVVDYGYSIVDVADEIRSNVIALVEGSTGLEVVEVNINVADVHLPEEDSESASRERNDDLA